MLKYTKMIMICPKSCCKTLCRKETYCHFKIPSVYSGLLNLFVSYLIITGVIFGTILFSTLKLFSKEKEYRDSYVHKKYFYKRSVWDDKNKRYYFEGLIPAEFPKDEISYYEVYTKKNGKLIFSKKYVKGEMRAILFYNKVDQLYKFVFYADGLKKRAIFFSELGKKTKEYDFEAFSGRIIREVIYRKDGKTLLKESYFEHLYLRKLILYYSNGKKRSETEYFEGRKIFYDRKGKKIKVKRFKPQKIK